MRHISDVDIDGLKSIFAIFEANETLHWPRLNNELLSSSLNSRQIELGQRIINDGLSVARNIGTMAKPFLLEPALSLPLLRPFSIYESSLPHEQEHLNSFRNQAKRDTLHRPPALLSKVLHLYEEQLVTLRSLLHTIHDLEALSPPATPIWAWNSNVEVPHADPVKVEDPEHFVLLIHGIRTEAPWAERVAAALRRTGVIDVIPIRFGYLNLYQFLRPGASRLKPILLVHRQLRAMRRKHPNARVSVIAHSFGTYAICSLLDDFPDITIDCLILCGSIVKMDYRWDRIHEQIKQKIVNDCGAKDIWPRLASACSWGYGPTGATGFGSVVVRDRYHPIRHSDFFNEDFVTLYWTPYILYGQIPDSKYEKSRERSPRLHTIIGKIPLRWIIIILAIGIPVVFLALCIFLLSRTLHL